MVTVAQWQSRCLVNSPSWVRFPAVTPSLIINVRAKSQPMGGKHLEDYRKIGSLQGFYKFFVTKASWFGAVAVDGGSAERRGDLAGDQLGGLEAGIYVQVGVAMRCAGLGMA